MIDSFLGDLIKLRAGAFVSLVRMQALERAQHIWKRSVVASAGKRLVEVPYVVSHLLL